jgi:hypothetical protein
LERRVIGERLEIYPEPAQESEILIRGPFVQIHSVLFPLSQETTPKQYLYKRFVLTLAMADHSFK